ncbi:DEAD-box ATP-dependent RNA helicase 18 [Pelomyxa schiedti]|nr:DEAD-box ATP-dependent RNA helicase 18 [Pelomyxa schiedti]
MLATAGTWTALRPKLHKTTLTTLNDTLGFKGMTPVQAKTIPLFLSNKDVLVQACTGSGKTIAYVVPVVEMLLSQLDKAGQSEDDADSDEHYFKAVGGLIIAPTRELALQISGIVSQFTPQTPLGKPLLLTGGSDLLIDVQKANRGIHAIIVGSPGRILEIMEGCPKLSFKKLEVLVLDEADRLLELGFHNTLTNILAMLPKQRRTGLFSATMSEAVGDLFHSITRNPVSVTISNTETSAAVTELPDRLTNSYIQISNEKKFEVLITLLLERKECKVIVYFLTCSCVDYFYKVLCTLEITSHLHFLALHGKLDQKRRNKTFQQFIESSCSILLCTDVAARGLDFPRVDWILQYDAPQDPKMFVHRIGRTARMGAAGKSILFLQPSEMAYIEFMKLRNVPLSEMDIPSGRPQELPSTTSRKAEPKGRSKPRRKLVVTTSTSTTAGKSSESNVLEEVRALAMKSREIFTRSQTAFVSYVRGYKEHICSYIFQFQQLDLAELARGFALIRFPAMKELKRKQVNFADAKINFGAIPYLDASAEKLRQKQLEENKQRKQQAEKQRLEKEKLKRGREEDHEESIEEEEQRRQRKREVEEEQLDDINRETRLMRKLKSGKISKKQFDALVGDSDDERDVEWKLSGGGRQSWRKRADRAPQAAKHKQHNIKRARRGGRR